MGMPEEMPIKEDRGKKPSSEKNLLTESLKLMRNTASFLRDLPHTALEAFAKRTNDIENQKTINSAANELLQKLDQNEHLFYTVMRADSGGWDVRVSSNPDPKLNGDNDDRFTATMHYGNCDLSHVKEAPEQIERLKKKAQLENVSAVRSTDHNREQNFYGKETRLEFVNIGTKQRPKWREEVAEEGSTQMDVVKTVGFVIPARNKFEHAFHGREFGERITHEPVYTAKKHAENPQQVRTMTQYVTAKI